VRGADECGALQFARTWWIASRNCRKLVATGPGTGPNGPSFCQALLDP
jgi:hypothetical protein